MSVTTQDIIDHIEKWIDTTGWTEKYVQFESPECVAVSIWFEADDPRVFKLVSRDSFATLDKVTVYEVAQPGTMA